jgi:chromate reductase
MKILAFAGSIRTGSFNKMLLQIAVEGARAKGAEVTHVDLRDFNLPLYDPDQEEREGLAPGAKELKALFRTHQALLIASPENNSSISAVLKNAIDWVSRPETDDEPPLQCYKGKIGSIISASPGRLGGLRGLVQLRLLLSNLGVTVLSDQLTMPAAHEAFDEAGRLKNPKHQKQATEIGSNLAGVLAKLCA